MGSVTKAAGGIAAVMLVQAGMAAAPSAANAQPSVRVPCSTSGLISAITRANAAGGRVLRLAPRCNYVLAAPAQIGTGPDGLPIITGNVSLVGGPSTRISRTATAPLFRLIEVAPNGVLRVRNIFLTGGNAGTSSGGAIRNSGGTVELSHTTVAGNRGNLGGGLDNVGPGRMVVNASLIRGNTATAINGGGIFNDGSLSIRLTRVSRNRAAGDGGGLRNTGNGRVNVFRSTFDRNAAGINGGGISNASGSRIALIRTLISRNRAANGGGVFNEPGGSLTRSASVIRRNTPNNCVGCG